MYIRTWIIIYTIIITSIIVINDETVLRNFLAVYAVSSQRLTETLPAVDFRFSSDFFLF